MLSLEECKRMLQENGAQYSDEEVLRIRDLLYEIAKLDLELFHQLQNQPLTKDTQMNIWNGFQKL
jgi:ribosomal protein S6